MQWQNIYSMIKAGIFSINGDEKSVCSRKCDVVSPKISWYERDLDDVWKAAGDAIKGALESSGLSGSDIMAVSLTGHGKGVRPAIEGADQRAACIFSFPPGILRCSSWGQ
ncbi:hypothetical protein AGMMS49940_17190 [Spirochaetia bacterium]|nr:hypothetical protein AGMMS49940_17190 [Spirochaetia bacterium]